MTLIIVSFVVLFVLAMAPRCIRVTPQNHARVVLRLGHYGRTAGPGLAFCIPLVEWFLPALDLSDQSFDFEVDVPPNTSPPEVRIAVKVTYRVTNPEQATFNVAVPRAALEGFVRILLTEQAKQEGSPLALLEHADTSIRVRDEVNAISSKNGYGLHVESIGLSRATGA